MVGLTAENAAMQRIATNAAARYVDLLLMDALAMLDQLSKTPEAMSSDWDLISPSLEELSYRLPGVYFWVLPNGDYYTVDKGFTNLNLSDRAYFPSLFEGNDVLGYQIYSRSSGKKSALMASPILVNDEVVGALGASIFLDDLHAKINRDLMIPPDYTWFALNSEGLTMLDMDIDYIFMNALTESPESMQNAIATALRTSSGSIEYMLGNTARRGTFQKLPNLDWRIFLLKKEGEDIKDQADISLNVFTAQAQRALNTLDADMVKIMHESKTDFSNEDGIRTLMSEMLMGREMITEIAFVDMEGIMQYIEPKDYKNFEGMDISDQSHVGLLRKINKPVLSEAFIANEGFQGMSLAYPASDRRGKMVGSVSILIKPEQMIDKLIKDINIPPSHELWIMQTDGTLIYDLDKGEIGRNLFEDPLYQDYASLRNLGRQIAEKESGFGEYVFERHGGEEKVVKKPPGAV